MGLVTIVSAEIKTNGLSIKSKTSKRVKPRPEPSPSKFSTNFVLIFKLGCAILR